MLKHRGASLKFFSIGRLLLLRELLKFAGLVSYMSVVIGAKAYIWTKHLFHEVCRPAHGRHGWGVKRKIFSELKAHDCLVALCAKEKLTARELLKFAGLVNSMSMVIGVKAYIQTKPLFHEVCRSAHGRHA